MTHRAVHKISEVCNEESSPVQPQHQHCFAMLENYTNKWLHLFIIWAYIQSKICCQHISQIHKPLSKERQNSKLPKSKAIDKKNYITTKTLGSFPYSVWDKPSVYKSKILVNGPPTIVKLIYMEPRSYIVQTPMGQVTHHNWQHLKEDHSKTGNNTIITQPRIPPSSPPEVISNKISLEASHLATRSGRVITSPNTIYS